MSLNLSKEAKAELERLLAEVKITVIENNGWVDIHGIEESEYNLITMSSLEGGSCPLCSERIYYKRIGREEHAMCENCEFDWTLIKEAL